MRIKANNIKEIPYLEPGTEKELAVEQKLDELTTMLAVHEFDNETLRRFQKKFNNAIENKIIDPKAIDAFKVIDEKEDASRAELLDEFTTLLMSNKVDSKAASKYLKAERLNKLLLMVIGVIMVTLGLAMIIIPAPPYFEMFTIFYFTRDDGITLMDVISLIIILAGIYILIRTLYAKSLYQKKHD